ncbi:hypothetical protein BGZ59_007935 [Podila verticillata]|nr:hypothetical protein BGZ59_007935 [Podila verticillata]
MLCVNQVATGDTADRTSQFYTIPSLASATTLGAPVNLSSDFKPAMFGRFQPVDGASGIFAVLHDASSAHSSIVLTGSRAGSYWKSPFYYANVSTSFDDTPNNNGVIDKGGDGVNGDGGGSHFLTGAIAGIVASAVVVLGLFYWWCKSRHGDVEKKGGDGRFEEHKGEYLDPDDPEVIKIYQDQLQGELKSSQHPRPNYTTTVGDDSGAPEASLTTTNQADKKTPYSSPSPLAMDQAVFQTLTDTLSADPNARMAAELRLKELQQNPEYPLSLVKLALARECNISQRHSAAVQLKSYIDPQWSTKSNRFRGPEPPAEAYVVSKIAHLDWPDNWSNLLDVLVHHLKSGSADEVHGSMKVLAEFISKDVTHVQLPFVAPVLFPELLRIMVSEQMYSHATRSRCASIFRDAAEMMFTVKEEHPEAVMLYLKPIIGQWNEAFISILNKRTTDNPEIEVAEWRLKSEVLRFFNLAVPIAPKLMNSSILPVLSAVWQDLMHVRPRYVQEHVNTSTDITGESFQDSDGNNIGIESLLFVQFEFLQVACRRRKLTQSAFIGEDGQSGIVAELVWNILQFMQMTDEQAESWNADPNQFIADEEEDSYSFNVRIATEDLLMALVEYYEPQTLHALNMSIKQYVSNSIVEKTKGNRNWWKPQESSLLAVGLLAGELCDAIKSGEASPIDVGSLFDQVVLANLSEHSFPFLQGRAFVFASQFAPILPSNLAGQYVSAAVEAILKSSSAVVKISALKALNNFNQYLDKQHIIPYQRSILQGVAPMIEITTEETLSLILRTLVTTSKIDEEVAAEYESVLGPLVLESWVKFPAEHLISTDIMEFFDVLARNKYMQPALSIRTTPALVGLISNENPDQPQVSSAIDLLKSLIQGGPSPLPANYVAQFFPRLMSVLLTTDDRDILQGGQECLIITIRKDVQQIAEWRDEASGKSGMDLIIQFIAQLLDPSQTESASLFVGDLISALIKKGGDLINSILPELLNAVTVRLTDAKLPSFIQPLIMVFAQLCLNQHEVVINFLSGVTINGRNGLDIVLTSWTTYHSDFQGQYQQKVSAVALTKVFMSNDPRVSAIQVRGNMIVSSTSRVKTRSKAKSTPDQYTVISVPVKIVKLLSTDLTNKVEEEAALAGGGKAEDDESDLDDEDEDDDEFGDYDDEEDEEHSGSKSKKDKYGYLSDLLDAHGLDMDGEGYDDDEEDEMDPDILADPIYQMSLKTYLIEFFRECIQQSSPAFAQSVAELSDVEKQALSTLLEN